MVTLQEDDMTRGREVSLSALNSAVVLLSAVFFSRTTSAPNVGESIVMANRACPTLSEQAFRLWANIQHEFDHTAPI